jgi:hypothetical protein
MMRRARSRSPKYLSIGPALRVVALTSFLVRFLLIDRPCLDVWFLASVPRTTATLKKEVLRAAKAAQQSQHYEA